MGPSSARSKRSSSGGGDDALGRRHDRESRATVPVRRQQLHELLTGADVLHTLDAPRPVAHSDPIARHDDHGRDPPTRGSRTSRRIAGDADAGRSPSEPTRSPTFSTSPGRGRTASQRYGVDPNSFPLGSRPRATWEASIKSISGVAWSQVSFHLNVVRADVDVLAQAPAQAVVRSDRDVPAVEQRVHLTRAAPILPRGTARTARPAVLDRATPGAYAAARAPLGAALAARAGASDRHAPPERPA